MPKLLHIISSPREDASKSVQIAEAYIENRKRAVPTLEVDTLNLWSLDMPEFDGDKAAAKMTFFGVGEMDETRQSAWDQVVALTEKFKSYDLFVFSVPMWNGGVPYKLKQFLDIITQPGLLFGFDPIKGYFGLLDGKKATLVLTSGVFAPGADEKYGKDFHGEYMRWWLGLVGIQEASILRFQPSLLTADPEADLKAVLGELEPA